VSAGRKEGREEGREGTTARGLLICFLAYRPENLFLAHKNSSDNKVNPKKEEGRRMDKPYFVDCWISFVGAAE